MNYNRVHELPIQQSLTVFVCYNTERWLSCGQDKNNRFISSQNIINY